MLFFAFMGICFFIIASYFLHKYIINTNFDKEQFLSKGYTQDEIELFSDIGFLHGRIRKWETDIKVEIIDIEKLSKKDIEDVDSIIIIIEPLIFPIKIYRVLKEGNLKVYRKVEKIYKCNFFNITEPGGTAMLNPHKILDIRKLSITTAKIYEKNYSSGTKTLLHEFLHAIGLWHASRPYNFHIAMATRESPNIFYSLEELDEHHDIEFFISEQEKQVIRMIYSSGVKSGLKRKTFMKEMGLKF